MNRGHHVTWLSIFRGRVAVCLCLFLSYSLFLLRRTQVLLACLFALSAASPQFGRATTHPLSHPSPYRIIQVLRDERVDRGDGNYNYEFETENGIYTNVEGRTGSVGQSNKAGSFR